MVYQNKSGPQMAVTEYAGFNGDEQARRCLALLQAIVVQGIADATAPKRYREENRFATREAKDWMGSRDYRECCENALMDPDFYLEKYRAGKIDGRLLNRHSTQMVRQKRKPGEAAVIDRVRAVLSDTPMSAVEVGAAAKAGQDGTRHALLRLLDLGEAKRVVLNEKRHFWVAA